MGDKSVSGRPKLEALAPERKREKKGKTEETTGQGTGRENPGAGHTAHSETYVLWE